MSHAWETTTEDVANVIASLEIEDEGDKAEQAFDSFGPEDMGRIEKAALYGDEMEEQTDFAYDEIKVILKEKGRIKLDANAPESKGDDTNITERWEWVPE